MAIAQFAYFKDMSADQIVRHIKDIIADSNLDDSLTIKRALAARTYLVSQVQHLLSKAILVENDLKDIQKKILLNM